MPIAHFELITRALNKSIRRDSSTHRDQHDARQGEDGADHIEYLRSTDSFETIDYTLA